jgi:hypothetical protein
MRNELTANVYDGIQTEADARSIGLVTDVSNPSGLRDERTMRELRAARGDAVFLIPAALPGEELRALNGSVPTISLTRRIDGLDSIVGDDRTGGKLLTEHFMTVILGPTWSPLDRVLGYEEAGPSPRSPRVTRPTR